MNKKSKNHSLADKSAGNKKSVLITYFILQIFVILTLILQILNRNFENVYICILTLILFAVPSLLERRFRIRLPNALEIIVLFFIFSAEILGEIREYYIRFPYWDTILHTVNGFLFAAIGFSVVNLLNENKHTSFTLSPFYVAITAFCFSMSIGVLWEFFEWAMDSWFGLDMQKDTILTAFNSVKLDEAGRNVAYHVRNVADTVLIFDDGHSMTMGLGGYLDIGLNDTMKDLLVNLVGAVTFSFLGYFYVKTKGKGKIAKLFIPEVLGEEHSKENENK